MFRWKHSRRHRSRFPDDGGFKDQIYGAYLAKTGNWKDALVQSGLKEEEVQTAIDRYTRQYARLIESAKNEAAGYYENQRQVVLGTYNLAELYYLSGNQSRCRNYADSAIAILKQKLKETPDDERLYATLGKCFAFMGDSKEAIRCGEKAVELLPVNLDALFGPEKIQSLMKIHIILGNYNLALDKIEYLLKHPSDLSPGILMVEPFYDKLRGLPRFQKIIDDARKGMKVN